MSKNLFADSRIAKIENNVHWLKKQYAREKASASQSMAKEFKSIQSMMGNKIHDDIQTLKGEVAKTMITRDRINENKRTLIELTDNSNEQTNFILGLASRLSILENTDLKALQRSTIALQKEIREVKEDKVQHLIELMDQIWKKITQDESDYREEINGLRSQRIKELETAFTKVYEADLQTANNFKQYEIRLDGLQEDIMKTVRKESAEFSEEMRVQFLKELEISKELRTSFDETTQRIVKQSELKQQELMQRLKHSIDASISQKFRNSSEEVLDNFKQRQSKDLDNLETNISSLIEDKIREHEERLLDKLLTNMKKVVSEKTYATEADLKQLILDIKTK